MVPLFTCPGHRETQRRAGTSTRPWQVSARNSGRIPGALAGPVSFTFCGCSNTWLKFLDRAHPALQPLGTGHGFWGENTAFDLRKRFSVQMDDERGTGGRRGVAGQKGSTALSRGSLCCWAWQAGHTHRGFPHFHSIKEVLPRGLLRIVSKEKWNIFLMVNHKRMLLHPASYGL